MFPGQARLKRHVLNVHEGYRPFQCDKCPLRFSRQINLNHHDVVHHEGRTDFQCGVCGHRAASKSSLSLHMSRHKKNPDGTYKPRDPKKRILKKKKCQVEYFAIFQLFCSLDLPLEVKLSFFFLKFQDCGQEFHTNTLLSLHYRQSHGKQLILKGGKAIIKCEYCQAEMSKASMDKHLKNVHNMVSENFKVKDGEVKPANKLVKCDYCQKIFHSRQGVRNHIKSVHKQIKDLECGHCGKEFSKQNTLSKHITDVHLGLRKIKCQICGKEYSKPDNLKMHIKHVHDKIRYVKTRSTSKLAKISGKK